MNSNKKSSINNKRDKNINFIQSYDGILEENKKLYFRISNVEKNILRELSSKMDKFNVVRDVKVSAICDVIGVSRQYITRGLKNLYNLGLIDKFPSQKDARQMSYILNPYWVWKNKNNKKIDCRFSNYQNYKIAIGQKDNDGSHIDINQLDEHAIIVLRTIGILPN